MQNKAVQIVQKTPLAAFPPNRTSSIFEPIKFAVFFQVYTWGSSVSSGLWEGDAFLWDNQSQSNPSASSFFSSLSPTFVIPCLQQKRSSHHSRNMNFLSASVCTPTLSWHCIQPEGPLHSSLTLSPIHPSRPSYKSPNLALRTGYDLVHLWSSEKVISNFCVYDNHM